MLTVAELIEELAKYPPDMRVFVYHDPEEGLYEPIWRGGDMVVKHVDYPIPHIGEFCGNALVLGTDE